jgi:hypothetical protein
LDIPPLAIGAPMEEITATLLNAINRQREIIREQNRKPPEVRKNHRQWTLMTGRQIPTTILKISKLLSIIEEFEGRSNVSYSPPL